MKKIISILAILLAVMTASAQKKNYTAAETRRLADLGRIWGMVNYFHPAMGDGNINSMDLVVPAAADLANDPSAENFRLVVRRMLARLGDPATAIDEGTAVTATLFSGPSRAAVQRLASGYWYIALPTLAISGGDVSTIPGVMPAAWDSAKGIIMDLRNSKYDDYIDIDFLYDAMPAIEKKLLGNTALPETFERFAFHYGMTPQEDGENNIYYSGWQTQTNVTTKSGAAAATNSVAYNKPLAFVINRNTSFTLVKKLLSLRAAGKCLLIYEGSGSYASGNVINVPVADSLTFHLRCSDLIVGANGAAPAPDLVIPVISDFSESGDFLQRCVQLLDKGLQPPGSGSKQLPLRYSIPRFEDTKTGFTVGTGERLLALYNHWNAIRYFFPYKHLLQKDWNTILEEYIPIMVNAKDSVAYNYALRTMITEIHDSHGFFRSTKTVTPIRSEVGNWPPSEQHSSAISYMLLISVPTALPVKTSGYGMKLPPSTECPYPPAWKNGAGTRLPAMNLPTKGMQPTCCCAESTRQRLRLP